MGFIVVGFIALIIDVVYTTYAGIKSSKDDNGGKINWFVAIPLFAVGISSVIFGVNDLPIKDPMPKVREDAKSVYFYSEPEDNELFVSTEYSLNTDDTSAPSWTTYNKGDSLPIETSPTKIYYRSRFLWRTTDTQSQTAFIDDYGRVYLDTDFAPDITYKSITAEYNARDASDGKKGNTYNGYTLTEDDFTVTGIDKNGSMHKVKGFSFSPTVLHEGKNLIEVEYTTSSGQNFKKEVTVTAFDPKLLSITAQLSEGYQKGVLVGSKLSTDMFEVMGTYEDDEKKKITEFTIDPEEVVDEGDFKATIGKDGLKTEVAVRGVTVFSTIEKEQNNSIETANTIGVNTACSGTISDKDDVDYYLFTLAKKGKISLVFKHAKIDTTDVYWKVALLSKNNDEPILTLDSKGASSSLESNAMRLGKGTYYIRVNSDYKFVSDEYEVMVKFTEEDDTFETEPNGDIQSASTIQVNSDNPYTGNLAFERDIDYYKFTTPQKGKMCVIFSHAKKDNNNIGWRIRVLGSSDSELENITSGGSESDVKTPYFRAAAGEYYIMIERNYSWSNIDYQIKVEFTPEDDKTEVEPNNDYDIATNISNGNIIIGNIQSENDIDMYRLDYNGSGDFELIFGHPRFDNSNNYWQIELYSKESSKPIASVDKRDATYIRGNDSENVAIRWNGLSQTVYYLKIKKSSFCSDDYTLIARW